MAMTKLRFAPIDLDVHSGVCIDFRADAFICSFGTSQEFHGADGKGAERYVAALRRRLLELPGCAIHVWSAGTIVGQIEMDRFLLDPSIGYVSLYYLS